MLARRFFSTVILMVVMVVLLVSNGYAQQTVLNLAGNQDRTGAFEALIAEFESQNPDIKVVFHEQPGVGQRVHDRYVSMLAARDSSFDVMSIDVIWPSEFVMAGWIDPLDDLYTEEELKGFLPSMIEAATIDGQIYAIPWMNDFGLLLSRTDLLEAAGYDIPETWEELVNIAKELQDRDSGLYGYSTTFARDANLDCNYYEFLHSKGGRVLDEDGNVVLYSPEAIEALEFMIDMMKEDNVAIPGIITTDLEEGRIIFQEGNAVFHRNWIYAYGLAQLEGSPVKGNIAISRLPAFPGGRSSSTLGGWLYALNAYSKNKDEAKRFIKFASSHEGQKIVTLNSAWMPARIALYKDEEIIEKYPHAPEWLDVALTTDPRPKTPRLREISEELQVQLHEAFLGRKTAEQAIRDLHDFIEGIVEGRL